MNAANTNASGKLSSSFNVVIVGAGSGGIAVAASLLKRNGGLSIALIDPSEVHYYQPGWTMVGGGVFSDVSTKRMTGELIPRNVTWVKQAVIGFAPDANEVQLDNGETVSYEELIVAPGLVLNWEGVKGLQESLGKNGVTSNYSYKTAPYTWELVQKLKKGRAIFSQPPMPIKCAGAPQKALYLSADYWFKQGLIDAIDIDFFNAGGVLFGVPDYVPALQSYMDKYKTNIHYSCNLTEVDGENQIAHFKSADDETISKEFDMLHVCPPQKAPTFIAESSLSDDAGWLDVNQFTLQHAKYENVWGLGDVMNTPNAKTMAAVRKQVPVVAENITKRMSGRDIDRGYDGYGSCPLTVENGKIVLAEFGYGGKLLPSFPLWMVDGTTATKAAWILKADLLPPIYWNAMLKGREWLAAPKSLEEVQS